MNKHTIGMGLSEVPWSALGKQSGSGPMVELFSFDNL